MINMYLLKYRYLLIIIVFVLVLTHCRGRHLSFGYTADIFVLADSTIWEETEAQLHNIFERPLVTPQRESVFLVQRATLAFYKNYNNLIFITALNDRGDVTKFLENSLSSDVLEKVKEGTYLFVRENLWSDNQLVMFLVTNELDSLKMRLAENSNHLFNIFNDYWNDAKKSSLYSMYEEKQIEKYLKNNYAWSIRVPHNYSIEVENNNGKFILLRHAFPERTLDIRSLDRNR